ncbi:cytochrome P450 [Annulohypoxylon maeteangense]|uniref:cytochrome P450 n=1 Tax=Annulohypoxylon maeteangense TaxID=1927788 RepID=UPI0020080D37|nr:cytochrome P450 [Annulohypoxylon maeteangense]KAI0886534.1 cytochrome P450 [Annulohypoxylon maeteangense]
MASPNPLSDGVTYFLCGFISLVALYVGYQVLLHPLRSYPGPLIAKLTNGYTGFFAFKRILHIEIWRTHEKHGPVVRIGPDRLVFNSATAMRDIYQNERVTKAPIYLATQSKPGAFSLWNALDRDLHRRKRKLVGRTTTDASMRAFEPSMIEQVDIFIKHLANDKHQATDVKTRCSYLSFDIVGLLSFGYSLHLQTNEENQFLVEQLVRGNHRMNTFMQIPIIPRYKLQLYINKFFQQEREKTARLMETMIRSRMAEDVHAKRDLYSHVADAINAKDDDSLRLGDLWYEAFFFIIAGGDTSATAMSATFFYLSRNPRCYEKLATEIRTTFQSADQICGSKLAGCQYLRACIDESLRMSPPSPGTLWRHLAPEEEGGRPFIVDGHVIPKGTKVGVNTYSLHHNEEYFPEPFTYNPDRWLIKGDSDEGATTRKAMHDAFAAFSIGSRGCAGKPTAYLEISLALAKTLWYFDFETAPGDLGDVGVGQRGEFHLYDIFTSTHDGPYLVFKPRDSFVEDFGDTA